MPLSKNVLTGDGSIYGPDAGGPIDSYFRAYSPSHNFSTTDKNAGITVSVDGFSITCSAAAYQGCRSITSRTSGLFLASWWVGYSGTAPTDGYVGFANSSASLSSYIGPNTNGVGFGIYNTAPVIYYNNTIQTTFPTINATARRIDGVYDFTNSKVWFRINEGWWNNSSTATPATNTGGVSAAISGAVYAMAAPADNGAVVSSAIYSTFPSSTASYPWG